MKRKSFYANRRHRRMMARFYRWVNEGMSESEAIEHDYAQVAYVLGSHRNRNDQWFFKLPS